MTFSVPDFHVLYGVSMESESCQKFPVQKRVTDDVQNESCDPMKWNQSKQEKNLFPMNK